MRTVRAFPCEIVACVEKWGWRGDLGGSAPAQGPPSIYRSRVAIDALPECQARPTRPVPVGMSEKGHSRRFRDRDERSPLQPR